MRVHTVWDFTFLYYKYKFALSSGHLRRLSHAVDWKGSVIEKDISIFYYVLAEIEKKRRELEGKGYTVVSTICFDMPSKRKELAEGGDEYKSGRGKKLDEDDFDNIQYIEKLLSKAGHNTYRYEGYEADDLVNYMVNTYKDKFDYTIIFTPDKDCLVNIDSLVGALRHKTNAGYQVVDINNYEEYLSAEFGCRIPYNAIDFFLCTVGDKGDKVKGINKFGPKAFDKLVDNITEKYNPDWSICGTDEGMKTILGYAVEFLKPEQVQDMYNSYELVKPMELDFVPPAPEKLTTYELRKEAYSELEFLSLIG